MRIIISENQLALIRRLGQIESLIDPTMDSVYEFLQSGDNTPLKMRDYDAFTSTVAMKLANKISNETTFQGDKKITLRNQIQRTILNNYYSEMRDYFMSKLEKNKNLNESEDKKKKFLKDKFGIDLTNKIKIVTSKYDVPMEFDTLITPFLINSFLNRFGPMYLFKINDVNYLFQDRGSEYGEVVYGDDESEYYDDEFAEKLGINMLGITISDLVNIYYKEEN